MFLEAFGTLDAPERHQEERQDRRAQSVESGADTAVDLTSTLEDPALDEGRHCQEDSCTGHARPRAEKRRRIINEPQVREETIGAAVGGILIQGERQGLFRGGWKSGQVWVRSIAQREKSLLRQFLIPAQTAHNPLLLAAGFAEISVRVPWLGH